MLPLAVGALLAAAALVASWWSSQAFFALVLLVVAGAGFDLSRVLTRSGVPVTSFLLVLGAIAIVVVAYWEGERRIGLSATLAVIAIASFYVVRGLRPDVLRAISGTIFGALYVGLLGAFAILVREIDSGRRMIFAFALILGGYLLGSWVGNSRLGGRALVPSLTATPTWWGVVFGLAGSLFGSFLSLTFMPPPFVSASALALGAIVGVGCTFGTLGGRMIRADLGLSEISASVPGLGGIYSRLDALMVTIPAFYYGVRLYLT